jgi:hypothetical protein
MNIFHVSHFDILVLSWDLQMFHNTTLGIIPNTLFIQILCFFTHWTTRNLILDTRGRMYQYIQQSYSQRWLFCRCTQLCHLFIALSIRVFHVYSSILRWNGWICSVKRRGSCLICRHIGCNSQQRMLDIAESTRLYPHRLIRDEKSMPGRSTVPNNSKCFLVFAYAVQIGSEVMTGRFELCLKRQSLEPAGT